MTNHTPTPFHDELVEALHELVALHPWRNAEETDALTKARDVLSRTPLGAPTGWACEATNSGVPNYLRCGRDLYRYATPTGIVDQCGAGLMTSVVTPG